jgi:3alpha(or 20beta)-hydroxysteroid dehydrogenase
MTQSNQTPLHGHTAIVTGAARGIGLAIATRLAADGADVLAFDLPDSDMTACKNAVSAAGRRFIAHTGDVTVTADWSAAVAAAQTQWGRLDILVNNAGISGRVGPLIDYDETIFDRVMSVNTRSVFLGMKHAARAMTQGGVILNIASVSGLSGSRGILPYTASKHAVIGMTKAAALELAPLKIRVLAVCPAPTDTAMMSTLEQTLSPDNPEIVRKRFHDSIPLGRYGDPQEIAAVVSFLAGSGAGFMTGSAVVVDGGMLAS